MAGSFIATGVTFSNLTRLELEQLRKADFFAGGKALTVGDDGTTVGPGDINAEPYATEPSLLLDDVYGITPPTQPGPGLATLTQLSTLPSETVKWYGPNAIQDGTAGRATAANTWTDTSGVNFSLLVQVNDILLIKPKLSPTDLNAYCAATVSVVAPTALTLINIHNPTNGVVTNLSTLSGGTDQFEYVIIRPSAVQLFAVPGSGPTGAEQTFLMVVPGSTLHNNLSPTLNQINADRVKNIVPATYALDTTVDRSDAVYGPPNTTGPRLGLDQLGYRVILYPDNGTGTAPDLMNPITAIDPLINPSIPVADQRMTFDFKAGVVRFSCAPAIGGQIKVSGGVNATTGRLNLYAVFWAVDTSLTQGAARSLYGLRSTDQTGLTPGKITFDTTTNSWRLGSTTGINAMYVRAPNSTEDATLKTEWGAIDTSGAYQYRYFAYRSQAGSNNVFTMLRQSPPFAADDPQAYEVVVADKTEATVADSSNPPQSPAGDYLATGSAIGNRTPQVEEALIGLFSARGATGLATKGYGTLHLRRGFFNFIDRTQPITIPPGIVIEGEGDSTVVRSYNSSLFKMGPNTPWGVWDINWEPDTSTLQTPPVFNFTTNERLEGVDLVWNPNRRVWGVVHADTTLNAVYFNEIKTDGTTNLPGLGINVKDSVRNLFTTSSMRGQYHTSSHYPRVAYAASSDQYMIVWVEENGGATGPVVMMQVVNATSLNPLTFGLNLPNAIPILASDGTHGDFSDHPSVAADPSINPTFPSSAVFAISYWGHGSGGEAAVVDVVNSSGAVQLETVTVTYGVGPVSSTDVAADANGSFLMAWSEQAHPILSGTNGTLTAASRLTDPGVADWTLVGLQVASSKFLHLGKSGSTNADYGKTGFISDNPINAGYVTVLKDIDGNVYPADAGGVQWAFAPACTLRSQLITRTGTFTWVAVAANDYTRGDVTVPAGHYAQTPRELDYVRLSYGDGHFLLVFQAFNTTSYLAKDTNTTFDGGINTNFPEASLPTPYQIKLQSRGIYRHHVSTCGVLLEANGTIADKIVPGPNTNFDLNTASANLAIQTSRDLFNSNISLGSRAPSQAWPNWQTDTGVAGTQTRPRNTPEGYVFEIAPRNFFYKWGVAGTPAGPPGLIPDVTWTGTDWVVVSPVHNHIHSDTGFYWTTGGNFYFSDATFYFGNDAPNAIDSNFLRKTIPSGSQIYIPAATVGSQYQTFTILDEHTIVFSGAVAGLVANTQYEWYLVMPDTVFGTVTGGIKNPGYRVSSEGRVIISSSYTTFADDQGDTNSTSIPRKDETIRKATTATANGNTGDQQSDNLSPYYGTSRIEYDVGFKGVAVGAPKGVCELVNDEHPMCAIAWGENFYGFLDRHISGLSGGTRVNQTVFFRQSFGPFRNGIRNLRLEQVEAATSSTRILNVATRYPVFTRHDCPASSTGHFATDGYRNFFVSPNVRSVSIAISHRSDADYVFGLDVHTTDALGRDAVRSSYMQASGSGTSISSPFVGTTSGSLWQFMSDLRTATSTTDPNQFSPLSPGKPVVVWNGTRPVAFYTITDAIPGTSRNVYLVMTTLPGSEDANRQTWELTEDSRMDGTYSEIARLSVGTGDLTAASTSYNEPTTQIAVAFSGKTYAVLWCMGLDRDATDTNATMGYTRVGVTIFQGSEQSGGSAATYVLDNSYDVNHHANFSHPQIIWDGKQYVAAWVNDSTPYGAGQRAVRTVGIPENGLGSNQQLKVVGAMNITATKQGVDYIGTVSNDGGGSTDRIAILGGTPSGGLAIQPGDIITVTRAWDPTASAERPALVGSLQVVDVQYKSPAIYAYVQTTAPGASTYGNGTIANTTNLFGYVTSGGVTHPLLGLSYLGTSANALSAFPTQVSQRDAYFSPYTGTSGNVCYLGGLVYDEVADVYTILQHYQATTPASTEIVIQQFRKNALLGSPPVPVASTSNLTPCSALGWNGRHYLVVYVDMNGMLTYVLLSEKLQIVETGPIDNFMAIGYMPTSKPGPLYSGLPPMPTAPPANTAAQLRNLEVRWNNKLNRWIISGSYLWTPDTTFNSAVGNEIEFSPDSRISNGLSNVSSYTNNTITLTGPLVGVNHLQPGLRLQWYNNGTKVRQLTTTIMSYLGATTIEVDVGSSETTNTGNGATIVAGTSHAIIVPREDVFCWTLSYNYPVVQVQDADETFLENVTISGPVDIEEKYLTMTLPSWQSAAKAQGAPASFTQRHGTQFNHMLLTPTLKTETIRFSNVRSKAKIKHNFGMIAGNPTFDRYTFNRRG
jgi:hypothetical protein